MNLNLKAVYYCATDSHTWGKGFTIKEAKKNAKFRAGMKFYVTACVFDADADGFTEDIFKNLYACINANQIHGNPEFYTDGRTEEDTRQIETYLVGWLCIIPIVQ